jgi:hypothetical protein
VAGVTPAQLWIAIHRTLSHDSFADASFGPSTCSGKSQPASTATGAFSNNNNDGGAGSVTDALTVQDVSALASGNVAGVNLALGTITVG